MKITAEEQAAKRTHGWAAVGMSTVVLLAVLIVQLFLFLIGSGGLTAADVVVDVFLLCANVVFAAALFKAGREARDQPE